MTTPPKLPPAARARRTARDRGAVLIVALLVMAVLALALTSYLQLNLGSARLAQRGYQQAAAFQLAEAGAEEALWSFNRANAGHADAWSGWTTLAPGARRTFAGFDLGSATARVQVHVDNHQPAGSARPSIVALATVEAPGTAPVTKMLEVTLRRRARFATGLLAKEAITFAGNNASVDSWDSDPDHDPSTPPVEYGAAVRNDAAPVASVSVSSSAMLVNHADIFGYVYTGGAAPTVGANGSITGRHTPADVKIDPARVATNFTATFLDVAPPPGGTTLAEIGSTLGTPGQATHWRAHSITLGGKNTLTIHGHVTLVLTAASGTTAIQVTGQGSIIIAADSSLTVYTEGDLKLGGNGLANLNTRPATCLIYGTNTSVAGQDFAIAGNGALRAAVYAPNADVKIVGNGDVMGAIVARNITLTGNAAFHYDESLGRIDGDTPFGVERWRELTTEAARAAHQGKFGGW